MSQTRWWQGKRGEWYVIIQVILFLLVAFGPQTWPGLLEWAPPFTWLSSVVGGLLILIGGLLSLAGIFRLGSNLTPLPYPKNDAKLVETGPYRLVRHPIYSGLIFAAFGWALWMNGWLKLGYAALLFIFFDLKSRREEGWLREKFAGYEAYQRRVRKLIPFVY